MYIGDKQTTRLLAGRTLVPASAILILISTSTILILTGRVPVFAQETVDQAWAPTGPPPGGNAIKYHEPIGQSFKPTLDNLVGADVNILNNPKTDAAETTYVGGNSIDFHSPIGQSFTPTYGIFTRFDVYLMNSAGADRAVQMNLRSGTIGGPIIGSKTFSVPASSPWGWANIDMPSPISVNPGSLYVLELIEPVGGVNWGARTPGTYPGGNAIYNGADNAAFDNMFRTYGATDSLTANIRSSSIGGPIVGTSTISVPVISSFSWTHIDFTQFGITPGATYVLELVDPQGSASWGASIPGGYADGAAIIMGSATTGDNWFRTYGIAVSFDFSLTVTTSSSVTVIQGGTASWGVEVNLVSGSTQSVTLTLAGALPAGATSNTPIANSPSFTATVSIETAASTPIGTYPLSIAGSGGSVSHSVAITLIVNPIPPSPDFSVNSSTMTISMAQGSSGSSTITVSSINGFSAAVDLSASWVGSAPSSVTYNLPTPITPPSGSTATSPLTVIATGSASTGGFILRVTGISGSLTHQVDINVEITAAATTVTSPSTTAPTTETATVTTTASGTAPRCLIATAAYGSELAPEVQFLRNFRDNSIMKTRAGSGFMTAFNAWYYSFSPYVASYLANHWVERTITKGALYPLVGILFVTSGLYSVTAAYPELAAVLSGLLASSLIGAFYLGLPLSVIRAKVRRLDGSRAEWLLEKYLGVMLLGGLATLLLGELYAIQVLLIVSSATIVLSMLFLSASIISRRIAKRL